jgi:CRISPR-associated protein Csh2
MAFRSRSVFSSSSEKSRGAIGTTSVVPYSICQIHGWVNPFSAKHSGLEQADLNKMFAALWHSVNNANTRSKSNQSSLLLVQIVYNDVTDKLYGTDRLLEISTDKQDEQIRDWDDFSLNLEKLKTAADSPKVKTINYFTENETLEKLIPADGKFKKMTLVSLTKKEQSNEGSPN